MNKIELKLIDIWDMREAIKHFNEREDICFNAGIKFSRSAKKIMEEIRELNTYQQKLAREHDVAVPPTLKKGIPIDKDASIEVRENLEAKNKEINTENLKVAEEWKSRKTKADEEWRHYLKTSDPVVMEVEKISISDVTDKDGNKINMLPKFSIPLGPLFKDE